MVVNGELKHYDASCIATICNSILKAEKQLETEKQIEESGYPLGSSKGGTK